MIFFLVRNIYTFLATSGMTDSSLMETDFFGGTLGWGVLLFVGIWPAPAGGLLVTPTEILIIFAKKNYFLDIGKTIL